MQNRDVLDLFDYLYWMRDQVLAAAANLSPDAFTKETRVTTRDLRGTLVHELDVEWSWRVRLRGAPAADWGPDVELKPADHPTAVAIADHWRRDEMEMREWLADLSDADLAAPATGTTDGYPLWYFLMHIVSHGLQQLSDAATLLSLAGQSPGNLEFLDYADTRPDSPRRSRGSKPS
jgi:uncharacterized damage-inducible protein DinB